MGGANGEVGEEARAWPVRGEAPVERTLLSAVFDFVFASDFCICLAESTVKIEIKGSGQECPLHTRASYLISRHFFRPLPKILILNGLWGGDIVESG